MKGIGIDPNPEKSISDELSKLQYDFLRSLLEKGDPDGACELDDLEAGAPGKLERDADGDGDPEDLEDGEQLEDLENNSVDIV
jgi:hypothetical protein